jgi:hypothetical protein
MDPGPYREGYAQVLTDFPNTHFCGRLPQEDTIRKLSEALFTAHLFKPSYGPSGFITLRWAEAAAAGTPAFIPFEMNLPKRWRDQFCDYGLLVKDAKMVAETIEGMAMSNWNDALECQQEFVDEYMRTQNWFNIIKEVRDDAHILHEEI